jgi:FkbM family methyltransferase
MNVRTRSELWRRAARVVGRRLFHWGENNGVLARERNGEGWLLRERLSDHAVRSADRPFVLFDVGANVGEYTELALELAHRAGCRIAVHAFEPAPRNVAKLREHFASHSEVTVVAAAAGDTAGQASLYDGNSGSSLASLVPREVLGAGLADVVSVTLLRLDAYMQQAGIEHIDLLKLDVEGFELAALRGLGRFLHSGAVDMIQFEYGGAALDAGVTLRQLAELLTQSGYHIAKLFPRALELREYHPGLEHYTYANYVALAPKWLPSRAARG